MLLFWLPIGLKGEEDVDTLLEGRCFLADELTTKTASERIDIAKTVEEEYLKESACSKLTLKYLRRPSHVTQ